MNYRLVLVIVLVTSLPYLQIRACELPTSLAGKTLLFSISNFYTPNNTMADMLLLSQFKPKTYQLEVLKTQMLFNGTYQYQRFSPNFARFTVSEKQSSSNEIAYYSKTLICQTDRMGFVIFKFTAGVGEGVPHHDIGTYFIQD